MWKKEFLAEMYDGARRETSVTGSRRLARDGSGVRERARCLSEEGGHRDHL